MSKTVKVRIAVAVDHMGSWSSAGWSRRNNESDDEMIGHALEGVEHAGGEACYWVTAELALPEVSEAKGKVDEARPM